MLNKILEICARHEGREVGDTEAMIKELEPHIVDKNFWYEENGKLVERKITSIIPYGPGVIVSIRAGVNFGMSTFIYSFYETEKDALVGIIEETKREIKETKNKLEQFECKLLQQEKALKAQTLN